MSELRVALVAEGPTDFILIEAALKALLPAPFLATRLQPEPTRPKFGEGWGGVLRWCLDFASGGHAAFEDDPRLPGFDLFVIHLDVDVAEMTYGDLGTEMQSLAESRQLPRLPCHSPCPPATDSATPLRTHILAWAGINRLGSRTVLCLPSKATEAWLVAATVMDADPMLAGLECNSRIGAQLLSLPRTRRIRKTQRQYHELAGDVTKHWDIVRRRCSLAEQFSTDIAAMGASAGGRSAAR